MQSVGLVAVNAGARNNLAIHSNHNGSSNEIIGTSITIFDVLDGLRDRLAPSAIAQLLGVSENDIDEAIEYLKANRHAFETAYEQRRAKKGKD